MELIFMYNGSLTINLHQFDEQSILKSFPILHSLKGVEQPKEFHAEGDAYIHTMLVVQKAYELCDANKLTDESRFCLLTAAILHDIGKVRTSSIVDGRISFPNHSVVGANIAKDFLFRLVGRLILSICLSFPQNGKPIGSGSKTKPPNKGLY